MCTDGDKEVLIVLKGTGELLRQLPYTFQKLINDWRHLFWIPIQVSIPEMITPHILQNIKSREETNKYAIIQKQMMGHNF